MHVVGEGGGKKGGGGGSLCVCLSQNYLGGKEEGLCSLVDVRTPGGVVWESRVCFCFFLGCFWWGLVILFIDFFLFLYFIFIFIFFI